MIQLFTKAGAIDRTKQIGFRGIKAPFEFRCLDPECIHCGCHEHSTAKDVELEGTETNDFVKLLIDAKYYGIIERKRPYDGPSDKMIIIDKQVQHFRKDGVLQHVQVATDGMWPTELRLHYNQGSDIVIEFDTDEAKMNPVYDQKMIDKFIEYNEVKKEAKSADTKEDTIGEALNEFRQEYIEDLQDTTETAETDICNLQMIVKTLAKKVRSLDKSFPKLCEDHWNFCPCSVCDSRKPASNYLDLATKK